MTFSSFFHIFIYWWKKTKKKTHSLSRQYIFSVELHKLPIFNLFGRLNTFCRNLHFHVTIYFSYLKFYKFRFFHFIGVLAAFYLKPPFTSVIYAIWIKKKILPKKWLFQGFFHIFICWWKKTKKIHSLSKQYYFSLKLHKLPIFMLLSIFYDNIFIFL